MINTILKCMLVVESKHLALKKIALEKEIAVQKLVDDILADYLEKYEK